MLQIMHLVRIDRTVLVMDHEYEADDNAIPMMNRAKIWPTAGSGARNRLKAMKLRDAPLKMNSLEINMPMKVRCRTIPYIPSIRRKSEMIRYVVRQSLGIIAPLPPCRCSRLSTPL
jgi:hypothetical protein